MKGVMTIHFLHDLPVFRVQKYNKQRKRRIHLTQQINTNQKMQSYSIQHTHQDNQEFFEAFLLIQENALEKMLNLHQQRKSKNGFDLKLQDTVNL